MKTPSLHLQIKLTVLLWLCFASLQAPAQTETFEVGTAQDSFSRDINTGEWVFQFYNPDDRTQTKVWRYTPRNQVQPKVRSSLSWAGGAFDYRYTLRNEVSAKQAIAYVWSRGWFPVVGLVPERSTQHVRDTPFSELLKEGKEQLRVEAEIRDRMMSKPAGWYNKWNVYPDTGMVEFGWFPDAKDDTNPGVRPAQQLQGFGIRRPELPGLAFAEMEGATEERAIMGGTPTIGPVADALKQLEYENSTWTHVLVPAIAIPEPWDGAELTRRIKAHMQNWVKWQAMTQSTRDLINPKMDALTAAAQAKDKVAVTRLVTEIWVDIFRTQSRMTIGNALEDHSSQWQTPIPIVRTGGFSTLFPRPGPQPAMERIAARTLSFDLFYLLVRMQIGQ